MRAALLALALPLAAAELPAPTRHVHNEGVLSWPAESRLDDSLAAFESETGRRFVAALLPGAGSDGLRERARALEKSWKADLLLVLAKDEKRWRVEVGPALERELGAVEAGMVADAAGGTWLAQGELDAAVEVAAAALVARLQGRLPPPRPESAPEAPWTAVAGTAVLLLLGLIVAVTRPRARYGRRVTRDWEAGGGLWDDRGGGGASGSW